jgi:HK97 family phage major capsid protein
VAVEKLKALLDELAAVVAEMEAMTEDAPEGEEAAPMTEEQEASLRSLEGRADKLRERIEFLQRVQTKELELRSVLERAAPVKAVAPAPEKETADVEKREYAVPKSHGPLKAFRSSEAAYRAGMHIKGYVFGDAEARRWCNDHNVETRVQAGGVNSLGGVLTSPELSSEIIRLVEEFGVFPQYAKRVNMNSDTLVYARRTGGLTARPVGENVEVTASDVTFDNVELTAKIWGVANRTSNSLLEDSVIDLADAMAVETAQAFSEAFDNSGFIGDGTLAYHGVTGVATKILQAPYAGSVVTASGNATFDVLTMKNFTDLLARLPMYARSRNARWYISPAGWGSAMLRLAMLPGGTTGPGGNSSDNVAAGFGETFLGYPVTLVQSMESRLTGTTGGCAAIFGDLSQAAIFGERRAISIKTASERYIEFDQTLTFATTRNAMVVNDLGSTTKAGPVVALKFG